MGENLAGIPDNEALIQMPTVLDKRLATAKLSDLTATNRRPL